MKIIRTNSENVDFFQLVKLLDIYLAGTDGDEHSFYDQFNKIDDIKHVVMVYENQIPIGCGALKQFDKKAVEIKRMYTAVESRGKGIASIILSELEKWATELSYERCILETGVKQYVAIGLYHKNGYQLIANFGPYEGMENSTCFEKWIGKGNADSNSID